MDYQNLVQYMRRLNGEFWPGKPENAPAASRYPNIGAEIVAHGFFLWCPANHAGVSNEIMAAVLEDNEDITTREILGLARLFGCSCGLLSAPTLQKVDPTTNKGKYRLRQLSDLLSQVDTLLAYPLCMIAQTLEALERGETVTYSDWKRACDELMEERERPTVRAERMVAT